MPDQAVIFDLDGTLLDTLADIANAANDVLSELSFPTHSIPHYRFMVGDGVSVLFTRALPKLEVNPQRLEECIAGFQKHYEKRWNETSKPYAGVPEMLDALSHQGAKLAILSNKPQAFTEKCVKEFLSPWKFDMVLGQSDARPRKPDPAGVYHIAGIWQIPPSDCYYLGDTNTDIQTAISGGCRAVGVTWGFRLEQELRDSGAQWIIHHPMEFLSQVKDASPNS